MGEYYLGGMVMDYYWNEDTCRWETRGSVENTEGGETAAPGEEGTQAEKKSRKPSRKRKGALKVAALCLVCAVAGFALHPVADIATRGNLPTLYTGDREQTELNLTAVNTEKEMTPAEIYAAYVNSTVGITVDIVTTNIFGQTVKGAAAGSGFVITEDGYILTNYHVIEDANAITVAFVDGKTYPATLIGGEESNDIAVIKIDAEGLTPVVIGSSDDMLVGEQVVAIGNPLGELTFSETVGYVSALNRNITVSASQKINMIQTDCAINSGNSGGPLFNCHGEVIGIVSAKYSSSGGYSSAASIEGLGFAIPMDDVADMVSDLISSGYVTGKPLLGISVGDVESSVQAYGVPAGALVSVVTPGLCGEQAGLKEGDIITAVDGKEIAGGSDLIAAKDAHKPGDTMKLDVFRSGEKLTLEVTLEESTPEKQEKQSKAQEEYQKKLEEEQREQQEQQQQQGGSFYGWPFGGFDFGF